MIGAGCLVLGTWCWVLASPADPDSNREPAGGEGGVLGEVA